MSTQRIFKYPVWATQGGGLVREISEKYYFVEKPDCPGLDVGDEMPAEWDMIPANDLARGEVEQPELDMEAAVLECELDERSREDDGDYIAT